MKKVSITIQNTEKTYDIILGKDILPNISTYFALDKYSQIFIITDENIAPLFLDKLRSSLPGEIKHIVLQPGENAKTIKTVEYIWNGMKDAGLDRKSLVINLGGGVIGDMGGFAASTFMRGLDFINIPTTLLSQVDASVGGKTGFDFAGIKNLVGTFNQPIGVIIDTKTLETLPKREFISGFAEMIKHGLIADKTYFEKVTSKKPEAFSQEELAELITTSCEIKKHIVENDETEKGMRKLVNFGHTIGHAIESLSLTTEKPLLHGEAISIGMVAEAKISQLTNLLSEADSKKIKQVLKATDLPTEITKIETKDVFTKMQSDKKNEKGEINFTLLSAIGKAEFNQKVSNENIQKGLSEILQ